MKHAVVQTQMAKPDPEALVRAFRAVPELVDLDADTLSADGYGILVGDLPEDTANATASALNIEGVDVRVVPETDFPALPSAKRVHRVDCLPEQMIVYDAVGRETPVAWDQVVMVAAGIVTVTEFTEVRHLSAVPSGGTRHGGASPVTLSNISHKEQAMNRPLIDIYLKTSPVRLAIEGHEFQYNYLGDRLRTRYLENFALLVQDLASMAGNAILNRGAVSLSDDSSVTMHYPCRHAFEEEIIWLLWAASRPEQLDG